MPHVLVVEDDPGIRDVVVDYLRDAGIEASATFDVASALSMAAATAFDLVVVDLGLPGARDGLDLTRELRRGGDVPIVILTARDTETDRVVGLELGADDYVTKPFSPRELVARVRAVLRRAQAGAATTLGATPTTSAVVVGDLRVDAARRVVERDGRAVELTATEFDLLATLVAQPGRVFTRGQLLEAIRGVTFESYERAIDSHVKNLRRKLEHDPTRPVYVQTVRGVGYRSLDA